MKKIKLLNAFVLFLILIMLIFFVGNIYILSFTEYGSDLKAIDDQLILGSYTRDVQSIVSFILFFGLMFVHLGLNKVIEKGYFNEKSAMDFRRGALFFLISGIASLIIESYLYFVTKTVALLGFIGQDLFILLIGFTLYIVSDFIQNGNLIKQDNELTI